MRIALKFLALACILTLLSSCIGGGIAYRSHIRVPSPRLDPESRGRLRTDRESEPPSRSAVEKFWGEPDERELLDKGHERWRYKSNRLIWVGGFVIAVLIPLPLEIPIGHESVILTFVDDRLESADFAVQGGSHALVGFIPQMCGFRWAVAESTGNRESSRAELYREWSQTKP